ncbi:MAG: hypothetical protein EXS36_07595 [Pedosphaera sp.]|nr:hypothetical protein [Pedosphaera sp.]
MPALCLAALPGFAKTVLILVLLGILAPPTRADFVGKFEQHEFKVTWFGLFVNDRVEQDKSTSPTASFPLDEQNGVGNFKGTLRVEYPASLSGQQAGKLSAVFDPPVAMKIVLDGKWTLPNPPANNKWVLNN